MLQLKKQQIQIIMKIKTKRIVALVTYLIAAPISLYFYGLLPLETTAIYKKAMENYTEKTISSTLMLICFISGTVSLYFAIDVMKERIKNGNETESTINSNDMDYSTKQMLKDPNIIEIIKRNTPKEK